MFMGEHYELPLSNIVEHKKKKLMFHYASLSDHFFQMHYIN